MKGIKHQRFCIVFLFVFCLMLSSCKVPENILQISSDVDFSVPQKVQISFNEHIYDTTIVLNNNKLEINFTNEKDLFNGAYVCLDKNSYKITYKDMVFRGEKASLTNSFLPCIVYSFLSSFENGITLDSFDKERSCYYVKRNINDYFVVLEAYKKEEEITIYSIEIK